MSKAVSEGRALAGNKYLPNKPTGCVQAWTNARANANVGDED
jgi:hypothetical protein